MDKIRKEFAFAPATPVPILGVPFDNVTTVETIALVEQMIQSGRPHYIATANVDFLVQAARDVELRRILFDAHLVICDGTPLVWASRLLGSPLPERVAGSDVVPLLIKLAAEKGYRPFFLGASEDSALKAIANIQHQYPSIQIAGYYSPPYSSLLEMDHEEIRRRVMAAKPDLLLVGFGCPKQEKWINMHYRSLAVPVSIGVGGTIDFLAGKLLRAPQWMQKSGTEWIFRLLQEPRRLAKRYFTDLWYFTAAIVSQFMRVRFRGRRSTSKAGPVPLRSELDYNLLQVAPRLDIEAVHRDREVLERAVQSDKSCLIDLSKVEFIDSTGIGLLIRLQKKARANGQTLLLISPSEAVARALKMMRLDEFFLQLPSIEKARDLLGNASRTVRLKSSATSNLPVLAWEGELTAANAEDIWMATFGHLSARSTSRKDIAIDLEALSFIDSTGLGIMIRARKFAAREGLTLRFERPQKNVLNVIRLSKLEDYLLGKKS
jgi:N-acetylglucosaminyldiphosphoundecaprenol N-acetyl-beta-D-mannosaminyltransferase